ncbi:MAG: metallophosphoesterase [Candidatus Aenigmatarchaeota archaeon]
MSRAIYATDLHGNEELYKKLFKLAEKEGVKYILIGGDISPGFDIQQQRDFLEGWLVPNIEKFRSVHEKEVFIMMGNDDFGINMDVLEKAEKKGILKIAHNKVHKVDGKLLVGYSFIAPTPFFIKDWERLEQDIKKGLAKWAKKADPKKSIWMFHVPPYNTKLDVLYNGEHAGSVGIKWFIEEHQPLLTLHGHIHESPDMSGAWKESFGKTVSINPGNGRCVVFDLGLKEIKLIDML